MAEDFPVYDANGQRLAEVGGINVVKVLRPDGKYVYTTAAFKASAGNDYVDAYAPIRAETSAANSNAARYAIENIPVGWKLDNADGRADFRVVAISEDGQVVDNLSSAYLSFDESASTLTVAPVFGDKDFCVYVFRDEEAVNLFAVKSDGNASLSSILAQFEKDNRVLKQLQALQGRSLRTVDECEILPEAKFRKNKVLAFDVDGQPALWLSVEDIQSVYAARDKAAEILSEAKTVLAQCQQLRASADSARSEALEYAYKAKADAQSAQSYAVGAKSSADAAAESAGTASGYANTAVDMANESKRQALQAENVVEKMSKVYTASGSVVAGERGMIVPVKVAEGRYVPSFLKKD